MDWKSLFETRRLGDPKPPRDEGNRNPFQTDQDRIVFSRPFRRLQQKTQVHPLPFNAHVRNRLVHTLEVASVGRSLGYAIGTRLRAELAAAGRSPDDLGYLVQAVCLAHDIGNPPFGHAGEEVIAARLSRWLAAEGAASGLDLDPDLAHFDGNAQGFRILAAADGYRGDGGLRLTMATLGAFLKYPWEGADPRAEREGRQGVKFNVFATERPLFEQVRAACGLSGPLPRHPAVWIMEAADDIVYTLADLEDAVELGIIRFADYRELIQPMTTLSAERLAQELDDVGRISLLRAHAIRHLLDALTEAFVAHRDVILAGGLKPGDGLPELLEVSEPPLSASFEAARRQMQDVVYFNARKVEVEIGAHDVLDKALSVFLPACMAFAQLGEGRLNLRQKQALSLLLDYRPRPGMSHSEIMRCAVDFVAGMTDAYASWLAARLRGLDMQI